MGFYLSCMYSLGGAETHGTVQLLLVSYKHNSELTPFLNVQQTVQPSLSVDILLSHKIPSDKEVVNLFQLSLKNHPCLFFRVSDFVVGGILTLSGCRM